MPAQDVQLPHFLAVSNDPLRDKTYLQGLIDSDPSTFGRGQLLYNESLQRPYVKDNDDVIQDFKVKNQDLADDTLTQLHTDLVDANLEGITTLGEVQGLLIDFRNTLANYVDNKV